jgi:hypothetical protein
MAGPVNLHDGSGAGFIAAGTGFILAYGPTTPDSNAKGYAKGCVFSNQTDGLIYRNAGTKDSAAFIPVASSDIELVTATIPAAGTTIVCTFSEAVSGTAGTGWSVTASGEAVTVSSGSGSGTDTLTLTLSRTIESGEIVALTYDPGDIVTVAIGRALAAFAGFSVVNESTEEEAIPPTFVDANIPVAGTTLVVNFSEAVVGTEESGWTINPSGAACTVSSATGTGTAQLTLTLSRTIAIGETVTLDYSSVTGDLADAAANDLATFSGAAVDNDSTYQAPAAEPELSSATIASNGTTLTLVFSGNLTKTDATGLSIAFDNYAERVLTYASGSGTSTLLFTISANSTYTDDDTDNDAAPVGAVCTLDYAGAEFVDVTDFAVTNNSTVIPDPDLPEVVSTALPANWDAAADHTPADNAALQAVLDAWTPGAAGVIELTAGVDYGFITWPVAASGSADNWIIVRSSEYDHASFPAYGERVSAAISAAVDTYMPTISRTIDTAGSRILLTFPSGADYIRFIGINFESNGSTPSPNHYWSTMQINACNHIGWDRCRFWWHDDLRPVQGWFTQSASATELFVIGSRFENYWGAGQDSSPTWIYDGKRILIENNYMECIDNGLFTGDNNFRTIEDVTFRRNQVTRPLSWADGLHGTQKSACFEAKTGLRLLVEDNSASNGLTMNATFAVIMIKADGNGSGKHTTHVTVRGNKIYNCSAIGMAFHVSGSSPGPGVGPNKDMLAEHNLIYDVGGRPFYIYFSSSMRRIQIRHNTLRPNVATQDYHHFNCFSTGSTAAQYHVFKDNITGGYATTRPTYVGATGAISFNAAWGSTYTATHNIFYTELISQYDNDTSPAPLGTLTNNAFPTFAGIGYVDAANDNYRLTPGSTYSSTGASPASDGTDRGCDVDALEAIMADVEE